MSATMSNEDIDYDTMQCVMEIYDTATYILTGDDNGYDQLVNDDDSDDFGGSDDDN